MESSGGKLWYRVSYPDIYNKRHICITPLQLPHPADVWSWKNPSHSTKITYFKNAEIIILSVPNVRFSSAHWHYSLDPFTRANLYFFVNDCYFWFETPGVTWHLLRQYPFLLSTSLYPSLWYKARSPRVIETFLKVTLNYVPSCITKDSRLGSWTKWPHGGCWIL